MMKSMILKDVLYNCIINYEMNRYTGTDGQCKINMDTINNSRILYVVIAFNDATLIKYQHRLLKQFSRDKFSYLVADNSRNRMVAELIKTYCVENQIAYIKLPDNPLKTSASHAAALNWICQNVLMDLKGVEWVGFIDHDCFPIKETFVEGNRQNFYGLKQNKGERWYLWPGFCFFRITEINAKKLDFGCTKWGDTGSAMYDTIYKKAEGDLKFVELKYKQLLVNEKVRYVQECQIEILDNKWFHISNGSNWLNIKNEEKMNIVYRMLDEILK